MSPCGFSPSRAAGLDRLARFLPLAGRQYTARRNEDPGPGAHEFVSGLSPWLRHRQVTEVEVLRAVLTLHAPSSAGKFIQQLFWRGYFKGYLEARPAIWRDWRRAVKQQFMALGRNDPLAAAYGRAVAGRTGIDCFDAWIAELKGTGYLHHHARLWFASIWIFTLQLPWQLGAEFTYRHFIDGDPASNTLSWRQVAGLHTPGKHFLARAAHIAQYSGGRFAPLGLAVKAAPLTESTSHPATALPLIATLPPPGKIGLLLTDEDLNPESLGFAPGQVTGVAGASCVATRSQLPVPPLVSRYATQALEEALVRAAAAFEVPVERLSSLEGDAIADWAERLGVKTVVTACAPVGPVEEHLADAGDWLGMRKLKLVQLRRAYDGAVWPHATHGFSTVRDRIPGVIEQLDLKGGRPVQERLDL